MNTIATISAVIGYFATIGGVIIYVKNMLGKSWSKVNAVLESQVCQLRNNITTIYYHHCDEKEPVLREFERKNLDTLYEDYSKLGGNSYIHDLYERMRNWKVVT